MTKEEFKARWDSDDSGGGITYVDIAECATAWGICQQPRTKGMSLVRTQVLNAAGIEEDGEVEGGGDELSNSQKVK